MEKIPKGTVLIMAILIIGTMLGLLNQSSLNTALPNIMGDFQVSTSTAQWLTTAFALVTGIVVPITAFLIQRFTTKQVFVFAMGMLTAGTLLCAVSPNFGLLLTGRIVQAVGVGIMLPLVQTLTFILIPVAKRGFTMGMIGLAINFAPAIGPVLNGWLVEDHSWRLLFYALAPCSLLITVIGVLLVKNVTPQVKSKVDALSMTLSSLGFGGVLYGFSVSGSRGWGSTEVLISLAVGFIALGLFVWRQLTMENPLLELRVFTSPAFTMATVISMILMIIMLSAQLLLPIYMQTMLGYTALKSGLMLLPGAILICIMSPIAGRLFDKIGARTMVITGLSLTVLSALLFSNLTEHTTYTFLMVGYSLRMVGVSLTLLPVITSGMNSLPPALIRHGIPVNTTLRTVAGSIGTALLVTIMTHSGGGPQPAGDVHSLIHGMNVASMVTTGAAVAALILSFFIKRKEAPAEIPAKGVAVK
ncbi:DHA2 family efflux MFS transporter permease subunit [Paenibacillus tritici]|uniref:DHA2 family efflux MFS transporter permease subunit n=1 Tax=Paenibacillus tritici TaxID=1873425 RepID=UPI001BA98D2A|nr:DHA2 family efflux MFS transporter permease subunit [Paenibacillus tritici]QUL54795.1 DHA2 family efflux MFS transporter permease subunit [Paenibacillus tritici]